MLNQDNNYERPPFAYQQFERVLDNNGHEREARDVRVEAGHAYTYVLAKPLQAGDKRHIIYGVGSFATLSLMV